MNRAVHFALQIACLPWILSSPLQASSSISNVGGVSVNDGQLNIDIRTGYSEDAMSDRQDNRLIVRQHIDYAFTDWYAFRVALQQDKRHGDTLNHANINVSHRFELVEKRDYGWNAGARLDYTHRKSGSPHEIEVRFAVDVPINGIWSYRNNLLIEHDVGSNSRSGIELALRQRLIRSVAFPALPVKSLRVGIDMLNDFGRLRDMSGVNSQDHQIGPVVILGFSDGIYVQTSYRVGLSDRAADNSAMIALGRRF